MLTVEATWDRPIRIARANSVRGVASGSASASSHTAHVWVTVTSSSTPRAPMTSPASSSPRRSTCEAMPEMYWLPSSTSPVKWPTSVKTRPTTPISTSAARVPTIATEVRTSTPWER